MAVIPSRSLTQRMQEAAKLRVPLYEEVEADESATGQAATVVALVAVASGIAALDAGIMAVIGTVIMAFVGWVIWSAVTYLIGTKLFGGTATLGELLRTLGFAQSPGVLYVLGVIPILGGLVSFVVGIWILIAGIIAIRQALDVSTGKAVLTAIVGWLALIIPMMILGGLGAMAGAIAS